MTDHQLDDLESLTLAHNTRQARVAATNLPEAMRAYRFDGFPGAARVRDAVQEWADAVRSPLSSGPRGLVLQGSTGLGKSGLAACAVRVMACRGHGDRGLWNVVTSPGYEAEVTSGRLRRRPAPVWFETWADLRDRLRTAWRVRGGEADVEVELLNELRERVVALAVDDLDVDAAGDWKEAVVLRLLRWPELGRHLIVTVNAPVSAFPQRFGERCADRLLDPAHFRLVQVSGPSLRRRL